MIKRALQVNRQLYKAHRQVRTSVTDASKRLEEERLRIAHNFLIAQSEEEAASKMMQAGLVRRRGQSQ